jgi:hypothetical protein
MNEQERLDYYQRCYQRALSKLNSLSFDEEIQSKEATDLAEWSNKSQLEELKEAMTQVITYGERLKGLNGDN